MILENLKTHWLMCQMLRGNNLAKATTARLYFKAKMGVRNPPLMCKALCYTRVK